MFTYFMLTLERILKIKKFEEQYNDFSNYGYNSKSITINLIYEEDKKTGDVRIVTKRKYKN